MTTMTTSSCKAMVLLLVTFAAAFGNALDDDIPRPGILQIGSHNPIVISSNAYSEIPPSVVHQGDQISKHYSFYHPGASYMAVHFQHLDLGEGCSITVQEGYSGEMSHTYTGKGRHDLGTFWAHHIYGDSIEIILACDDWETNKAEFEVDEYAAGFPEANMRDFGKRSLRRRGDDQSFPPPILGRDGRELTICGNNDMRNAQCYKHTFPTEYNLARAVAKIVIHGTGVCTGWLVGSNNILVTNQHCIQNEEQALTSDYIFDFEVEGGGDCSVTNVRDRSISEVTYEASELVAVSSVNDYALIRLTGNPVARHGSLELDATRVPSVGEHIYIPQHPGGMDKEIAIFDSYVGQEARCEIQTNDSESCFGPFNTGYWDISYSCDTKGGTSGAPVISARTHKVIGLHHCGGGCSIGNVAVPIYAIYNDIKDFLGPPAVVATPNPTPPPTSRPTPFPTARPTPNPTPPPTSRPTPSPTSRPTPFPTIMDSSHPTVVRSANPTADPTPNPTQPPTWNPTPYPTARPTPGPTNYPTPQPTPGPTFRPTPFPTVEDSSHPTVEHSADPTWDPTQNPTAGPTPSPTMEESGTPTWHPTRRPSQLPTPNPSAGPTPRPSPSPTAPVSKSGPIEFEPCPADLYRFQLNLQTDDNGHETFWILKDGHGQVYMQVNANTYGDNTFYQVSVCVPSDRYKFTIRDTAEDGISGESGDGYFQVYLDGVLVASGGTFEKKDQYIFAAWEI